MNALLLFSILSAVANYRLDARLDWEHHRVQGTAHISWINTSQDTVPDLWFHLYPNAFQKNSTLMREAEEWFGLYRYRYLFGKALREARGFLSLDTLWVQDTVLTPGIPGTLYHLLLRRPVAPGETLRFRVRFTTQLPKLYSRVGYKKGVLHLVYWYPKLAAYDDAGWHPIDYHLWGESYADFGRYEVRLTLPENLIVGFTGNPDTSRPATRRYVRWLDSLAQQEPETLARSRKRATPGPDTLTLTLRADSVHDFALVLSPRFVPLKRQDARHEYWILALPEHLEDYLAVADDVPLMVQTYEGWYGPYPYRRLTVADGFVGAGGGMEYPQLVVIQTFGGRRRMNLPARGLKRLGLVDVICHEVAHQWFFGMVANNQMDEPWLDEAFATFTEDRFMAYRFPEDSVRRILGFWYRFLPAAPGRGLVPRLMDLGLYTTVNSPFQEVIDHTPAYRLKTYGVLIYGKGSHVLHMLRTRLGPAVFDSVMRTYVARYRFRHPHIRDFQAVAEEVSGQDLAAFFDNWLFSTRLPDYRPLRVQPRGDSLELVLWNPGLTNEAVPVAVDFGDTVVLDTVPAGHLTLRIANLGTPRRITVDPGAVLVERDRWNNARPRRWNLVPFLPFPDPEAYTVGVGVLPLWWPRLGWNPWLYAVGTQGGVRHNAVALVGWRNGRWLGALALTEPALGGAGRWSVGLIRSDVYQSLAWTLHGEAKDSPYTPRYTFWNLSLWGLDFFRSPDTLLFQTVRYGGASLGLGRSFATPVLRGRMEAAATVALGQPFFKGILKGTLKGSWPYAPQVEALAGLVQGSVPLQERFSLRGTLWNPGPADVFWPHEGPAAAQADHVARGVGVSTAPAQTLGTRAVLARVIWALPKVSFLQLVYETGRVWNAEGRHTAWSAGLRLAVGPVALYTPLAPESARRQPGWVLQLRF